MPRTRKPHPPEFRQQMVDQSTMSGLIAEGREAPTDSILLNTKSWNCCRVGHQARVCHRLPSNPNACGAMGRARLLISDWLWTSSSSLAVIAQRTD